MFFIQLYWKDLYTTESYIRMEKSWFIVDKEGLRKLQSGKDKTYVVRELVQNAWDESITECHLEIEKVKSKIFLKITDNSPEGFKNISHSYTLFAETDKRLDPEKRGRFNLGEKQVFAICDFIDLITTKGRIIFDKKGRKMTSEKIEKGTIISISFDSTDTSVEKLVDYAKSLLVPENIEFFVNGEQIKHSEPIKKFSCSMMTENEENGIFKRSVRKTEIEIYKKKDKSYLFEMGIPVCEIDCAFSISVCQKVPLSTDRETVPQSFLRDLFAEVLNNTYDIIQKEDSSETWVKMGIQDERITKEAISDVLIKRFGEKFCSASPNDTNSIDDAISHGYNVIRGSEMSKEEWERAKEHSVINSSTSLFGRSSGNVTYVEPTEKMIKVAKYTKKIAKRILGIDVSVNFVDGGEAMCRAWFDVFSNNVTFNIGSLKKHFFEETVSPQTTNLIIHELGHVGGNHTETGYHEVLTKLGSELVMIALREPEFFKEFL